ncbi:hypothetical protein GALL_459600 [mine drainage metagenome]|uniref:Uncharacterized protein n=1 Tax=mine drainage metagenome TaxID=410659 RepID=A0A1J5PNP4_9ZZZZ
MRDGLPPGLHIDNPFCRRHQRLCNAAQRKVLAKRRQMLLDVDGRRPDLWPPQNRNILNVGHLCDATDENRHTYPVCDRSDRLIGGYVVEGIDIGCVLWPDHKGRSLRLSPADLLVERFGSCKVILEDGFTLGIEIKTKPWHIPLNRSHIGNLGCPICWNG